MEIKATPLDPRIQKLVNLGVSGIDIMHGHLKSLMLEAEAELVMAQEQEEESEEAIDSMERKYWEGVTDTLVSMYSLTYDISFAIADKDIIRDNDN